MSGKNPKLNDTICHKICFKTEKLALLAMEKINSDPNRQKSRHLKSVYLCPEHKKWHMTSMTKAQAETVFWKKNKRESLLNPSQEVVMGRIDYLKKSSKIKNKFKK